MGIAGISAALVDTGLQLDDVNLAVAHGDGGVLSSQVTAILGSAATV